MDRDARRSRIAEWASLVGDEVPEGALADADDGTVDPRVADAEPGPDPFVASDEDA